MAYSFWYNPSQPWNVLGVEGQTMRESRIMVAPLLCPVRAENLDPWAGHVPPYRGRVLAFSEPAEVAFSARVFIQVYGRRIAYVLDADSSSEGFQVALNCAYRLLRRGPDIFVPKIKGGGHTSLNLLRRGQHVFSGQSTLAVRPSQACEEPLTARASG